MERTISQRIRSLGSPLAVLSVVTLFALVIGIDLVTGPELSFSLFYLLPVVLVSLRWGNSPGQAAALGAALAWLVVDVVSGGQQNHALIALWNAAVRFGFFSLFSWLLDSLHQAVERETALARTDPLTGIPNRRAFSEIADRELARSARVSSGLAFVVIDLDDFKLVNDRRGHEGGDEVLCRFAATARRALRSVDVIARMGGDEFALLLPDVDAATAIGVLRRLRDALTSREAGGIGCSMGVACLAGGTLSDAFRAADKALYGAKAAGKGSILLIDLVSGSAQDPRSTASGLTVPDSDHQSLGEPDRMWIPGSSHVPNELILTAGGSPIGSGGPIEVCAGSPRRGREDGGVHGTFLGKGVSPDAPAVSGDPGTQDSYPELLIRSNGDMVLYDHGSKPVR